MTSNAITSSLDIEDPSCVLRNITYTAITNSFELTYAVRDGNRLCNIAIEVTHDEFYEVVASSSAEFLEGVKIWHDCTIFHLFARFPTANFITLALEVCGNTPCLDTENSYHHTSLETAVRYKCPDNVRAILAVYPDPPIRDAVYLAFMFGSMDIMNMLIATPAWHEFVLADEPSKMLTHFHGNIAMRFTHPELWTCVAHMHTNTYPHIPISCDNLIFMDRYGARFDDADAHVPIINTICNRDIDAFLLVLKLYDITDAYIDTPIRITDCIGKSPWTMTLLQLACMYECDAFMEPIISRMTMCGIQYQDLLGMTALHIAVHHGAILCATHIYHHMDAHGRALQDSCNKTAENYIPTTYPQDPLLADKFTQLFSHTYTKSAHMS